MTSIKWIGGVVVLVAAFWAGNIVMKSIRSNPEAEAEARAMVNMPRPGFVLPDLAGTLHDVNEWNGKVLVVNFWATWCPPCREEMPDFMELQAKYGAQGLQFVGIALDGKQEVIAFVKEMGVDYPILLGAGKSKEVATSYGDSFGDLPYTVFISRDGLIAATHRGQISRKQTENEILPLL